MSGTILVLDDDPHTVDRLLGAVFGEGVHESGYAILTATTPRGAIAVAALTNPLVAFVSAPMAVRERSLMVDQVAQPASGARRRRIVLTGPGARFQWEALGADGYLEGRLTAARILTSAAEMIHVAKPRGRAA
jgi:hypothetical protein